MNNSVVYILRFKHLASKISSRKGVAHLKYLLSLPELQTSSHKPILVLFEEAAVTSAFNLEKHEFGFAEKRKVAELQELLNNTLVETIVCQRSCLRYGVDREELVFPETQSFSSYLEQIPDNIDVKIWEF